MTYRYHLKLNDGRLLYADGTTLEDAIRAAGVTAEQVRRHMPVKCLDIAPMPEDVKAHLAELHRERRELRRVRPPTVYTCQHCGTRSNALVHCLGPRLETLSTGEQQAVIPQTPPRTIPAAPLRPRRQQNEAPLPLEMPGIEAKQGRLF